MMGRYGIQAKLSAIWHKICHPRHDVRWRVNKDNVCPGDITCETCEMIIWCRIYDLSQKELQRRLNIQGEINEMSSL